jgi:hypothetical protein
MFLILFLFINVPIIPGLHLNSVVLMSKPIDYNSTIVAIEIDLRASFKRDWNVGTVGKSFRKIQLKIFQIKIFYSIHLL